MHPFLRIAFLLPVLAELPAAAQQKRPPEQEAYLYAVGEHLYNDKFEREHEPLDGETAWAIPFRKDDLYGFVDKKSGKVLVSPQFSQVYAVYADAAIVESPERRGWSGFGAIDRKGRYIIEPMYQELRREGDLYHGIASAIDTSFESRYQLFILNDYYTAAGALLLRAPCHNFAGFQGADTMAWFRYGPEYSVYGRSGKLLKRFGHAAERHFLGIFNNHLVFVENPQQPGQSYTGQDVSGKVLWNLPSDEHASAVFRMSPQVFGVLTEGGLSFTDAKGNEAPYGINNGFIGNGFEHSYPMLSALDRIPVQDFNTQKTGYIDKEGRLVIPCIYTAGGDFQNGEAAVLDSTRQYYGFINSAGSLVVPFVIPAGDLRGHMLSGQLPQYSEGCCIAQVLSVETDSRGRNSIHPDEDGNLPHRAAFFDRQGKMRLMLPDSVKPVGPFSDGLAPVVVGEERKLGFIDTSGTMAIPARYELAVAGAYPFPQVIVPRFIRGYAYLKAFKGYIGKDGREYFSGKRMRDEYNFSH